MDSLIDLGYWGLFIGSFLASTLIPMSADVLLVGILPLWRALPHLPLSLRPASAMCRSPPEGSPLCYATEMFRFRVYFPLYFLSFLYLLRLCPFPSNTSLH